MYSLFIDTLSSPAYICLFDADDTIISDHSWDAKHAEFDTLIESINMLVGNNSQGYNDIEKIICIIGPGSFTGIRVTTLVANTLGYSFGIPLYPVTAAEFFGIQKSLLPWILPLTKSEVLIWKQEDQITPDIVQISTLLDIEIYSSPQSITILGDKIVHIQTNNYALFLKNFTPLKATNLLKPLYARDPNVLIRK